MGRLFGLGMGIVLGFLGNAAVSTQAQLEMNYYSKSFVEDHIRNAHSLAAALLRMHFHDCFVRRDSPLNFTVRGFDFIDRVKSLVEAEYPGIVSCADIIALAARDAIGGPFWRVPAVRRDGVISRASEALSNIPSPSSKLNAHQRFFANKGLDLKDLVLSSAHMIGASHCSSFRSHLYNFTGGEDQDPSLESGYAANLKAKKCRSLSNDTIFRSDSAITTSPATKLFITQVLQGSLVDNFYAQFVMEMEKMGRIDVKTGLAGEIRKHCALVNSQNQRE
ncbi:hypothetical protein ACJRO7_006635 [Eucalyptus globulus]|uniref:peroxidase n=1 Tax=Eucalyptus globulus TaxID=34317 RepID=A0ABD3IK04_EUCGL